MTPTRTMPCQPNTWFVYQPLLTPLAVGPGGGRGNHRHHPLEDLRPPQRAGELRSFRLGHADASPSWSSSGSLTVWTAPEDLPRYFYDDRAVGVDLLERVATDLALGSATDAATIERGNVVRRALAHLRRADLLRARGDHRSRTRPLEVRARVLVNERGAERRADDEARRAGPLIPRQTWHGACDPQRVHGATSAPNAATRWTR